jgi:mannobiose 2-epimerase
MESKEPNNFSARIAAQLFGHILPFWCGPALDREHGGWMAWLSNDLKPDRSQPKGLIVNTRILWTFSAVHRVRPEEKFQEMAGRAFEFVMNKFWDIEHGGAFWRLNDAGEVIDDAKKIYGQAFCIYALAEFYQAFGTSLAKVRAIKLFGLIEWHAHDASHGGYLEVRRRNWSAAGAGARLSEKDLPEEKSMNNHLHLLEAYTNLYRIWKSPLVEERLRELIGLFETQILDVRKQHFHHFFDAAWNVRSDTYTFGHDIEGSWLLCEAAEALGDVVLRKRMSDTALGIAEAVLNEGIDHDGGLFYEGKGGQITDRGKECWPQAEAVVGFINAFQLSSDPKLLTAARRVWEFVDRHIVDCVHGEWFWRITENKPDPQLPKVSEWKGPYHGSRMCLEALHRLQTLNKPLISTHD